MTNPGDIVRVRARRGGRASVYEANAWCQSFTDGLLDGNGVVPNTVADLNVLVGGTPTYPDVVLAKNPAGYRIALDLVGQQAITITTPATNTRISSIVAYTDDLSLATTQSDVTGSPTSCGLIVVNGTASANPVPPTETEIRAAITADGAAGSQASYGIVANISVSSSTTTITNTLISNKKALPTFKITSENIDWKTFNVTTAPRLMGYMDGKPWYRRVVSGTTSSGNATQITIPAQRIISHSIYCKSAYDQWWSIPNLHSESVYSVFFNIVYSGQNATLNLECGSAMRNQPYYGYIDYFM